MPEQSAPPSVPMSDVTSAATPVQQLAVFHELFPGLTDTTKEAVVSLRVGIKLRRSNSALVKYVRWDPHRDSRSQGFSAAATTQFVTGLQSVVERLGPGWTSNTLEIISGDISYDWTQAIRLNNHYLFMQALDSSTSARFSPPPVANQDQTPAGSSEPGFSISIQAVVVNPDNTNEIWSVLNPVDMPPGFTGWSAEKKSLWWTETAQELQGNSFLDLPRALRPQINLSWTAVAPDGTQAYALPKGVWQSNPAATRWLASKKQEIEIAHDKAALWAFAQHAGSVARSQGNHHTPAIDSLGGITITERDWDLIDCTPPASLADFDSQMTALQESRPTSVSAISSHMTSLFMRGLVDTGLEKMHWMHIPSARQWLTERSWISKDMLKDWISAERSSVAKAWDGLKEKHKTLLHNDPDVAQALHGLLLWNRVNAPALPSPTNAAPTPVSVSQIQSLANAPVGLVDWTPLLQTFDVTNPETPAGSSSHPFVRWMDRLRPPSDVRSVTERWLLDNDQFNLINRLILRKKDAEETALNTELVDKLKAVLSISNTVLEETDASGGWWSRLRRQASTGTPDKWADAFMEFQNHMVKLFDGINKQIARDQLWLSYADRLVANAGEVDSKWTSWLAQSAQALDSDRKDMLNDQAGVADKKVEWNGRADALDSAQTAHINIKTANNITQVLLEKIRQSTDIKQRLQQRSTMFYWSSLNMFAGLQSLQRNTNAVFEQSEMVSAMNDSYRALTTRSLKEEADQRENLKRAFKTMSESETGLKQFYDNINAFQRDAVLILSDLQTSRKDMQEETVEVSMAERVVQKRRALAIEPATASPKP